MLNFVGQTQFIFMMFNGLKSYKKKLILVIYASGLVHENFGVCNKLAYNRNSHVGYSIFCHGLTQIRRVKLN